MVKPTEKFNAYSISILLEKLLKDEPSTDFGLFRIKIKLKP